MRSQEEAKKHKNEEAVSDAAVLMTELLMTVLLMLLLILQGRVVCTPYFQQILAALEVLAARVCTAACAAWTALMADRWTGSCTISQSAAAAVVEQQRTWSAYCVGHRQQSMHC